MRVNEGCAKCLYDKQVHMTDNENYLSEVREILRNRKEDDSAPYMVYLFDKSYEKYFGRHASYEKVKKEYNDFILCMEADLRIKIEKSDNPFLTAFLYSRLGNYIDFGTMNNVDKKEFLSFFDELSPSQNDLRIMDSFIEQCDKGNKFLLVADNCGEILLDKLFIEQLIKRFPHLDVKVMVRGEEVLNDATENDAKYVGMDSVAEIISNGTSIAGTIYKQLPETARTEIDEADVILAKGQGNYETMSGEGRHIYYSFLCKCDMFVERFKVPRFTGMFIEENEGELAYD